jgi:hypothetical protein
VPKVVGHGGEDLVAGRPAAARRRTRALSAGPRAVRALGHAWTPFRAGLVAVGLGEPGRCAISARSWQAALLSQAGPPGRITPMCRIQTLIPFSILKLV